MEQIRAQYHSELQRLLPAIMKRLGASSNPSRWDSDRADSVEILLGEAAESSGVFRPDGSIGIRANLFNSSGRWASMIHELVHSLSGGGTIHEYGREKGWEEGLVEHLQRLLHRDVLQEIGEASDEAAIAEREASWPFGAYLKPWEDIRNAFGEEDAVAFYSDLLRFKISERRAELQRRALASRNMQAIKAVSMAKPALDRDESQTR